MLRALLALVWVMVAGAATAEVINLQDHPARVFFGDDPVFASATYDDSHWEQQPAYMPGGWQARGGGFHDPWYWMRLNVDGQSLSQIDDPALHIGKLLRSVTYFNGVEIGRRGVLVKPVGGHRHTQSKAMPEIYPLPEILINRNGPNVIAIRVAAGGVDTGGIMSGPVKIANQVALQNEVRTEMTYLLVLGSIPPIIYVFALIGSIAAWRFAPKGSGLGWLAVSLGVFTPFAVILSYPFALLDPPVPPIIFPVTIIGMGALVLVPMLEFAALILKAHRGWLLRLFQASVLAVVFFPDLNGEYLFPTSMTRAIIWLTQCLLTFAIISVWAARAVLAGQRSAIAILVGSCAAWAGLALLFLGAEEWSYRHTGASPSEFLVPIFLLSLGWAGVQSLLESQARLAEVQGEVLRVQESERRRVAYDIHDGVGQWLSTIKLNLQILQGQHRGSPAEGHFSEVVGHVDEAISDTRRIAHDLSPAMIEKKGIAAAMESHGEYVSGRTGVRVTIKASKVGPMSATTQGHLYRIFQEALQNAIKHGRATDITASLMQVRGQMEMVIADNGVGFDKSAAKPGMGMSSMTQRAALIGARVAVESQPGAGTIIRLSARDLII